MTLLDTTYVYTKMAGTDIDTIYRYRYYEYKALKCQDYTKEIITYDCWMWNGEWGCMSTFFISDGEEIISEDEVNKLITLQELEK